MIPFVVVRPLVLSLPLSLALSLSFSHTPSIVRSRVVVQSLTSPATMMQSFSYPRFAPASAVTHASFSL